MSLDTPLLRRHSDPDPDHERQPSLNSTLTPNRTFSFIFRFWRGPAEESPWIRPALLGLLAATALLYLWGLGASGWANSFYSAAAQAGSTSWKAFFFGSSDAANAITVDKPPLALWPMDLSVRIFGLSSWSILVPQALMGVASVGLLYATVRRTTASAGAGLLAGAILATTPVATLMFRFNNPDALLVLLLIGSVAATLRAIEASGRRFESDRRVPVAARWLMAAGVLVGLAFLTKMLQAFLVVPGLAAAYLIAADVNIVRRVKHLAAAGAALLVSAGWWIAIVAVWPASSRPYIGGSQGNSILELTLGYNGFGRLTGSESGSVGGQGGWGETGLLRMFNTEIGGQIAWLLPAALILGAAAYAAHRGKGRTDATRAALIVWGGWLLVTGLTFSLMAGIFHAYYTVALAPAIAALTAVGAVTLWRLRSHQAAALVLALSVAATTVLGFALLSRADAFVPWLKWLELLAGLGSAAVLLGLPYLRTQTANTIAAIAIVACLLGPVAYSISTALTAYTGSIVVAGPSTGASPVGAPGQGGMGGPGLGMTGPQLGAPGQGGMPGGGAGAPGGGAGVPGGTTTGTPSAGGLLSGSTPSTELTDLLTANADDYTWVAATIGSNSAAGYQLAAQEPVMAIGGFNGTDPSPTLDEFESLVAQGRIHYFIAGSTDDGTPTGMGLGGLDTDSEISTWVTANFTAQDVGGITVYDLTTGSGPTSGSQA
jgi:4-amino-4-deoxy-L-arabinose transferase-like glycosyltransferase